MDYIESDVDIISVANASYDAVRNYMEYIDADYNDWDDLKDEIKYVYVLLARLIIYNKIGTPFEIHEKWKELMLKNGQKFREDETNSFRNWDSALIEWDKLKEFDKNRFRMFTAIVNSLKEFFLEE